MHLIKEQDWKSLPESAQQEVYAFFIFIKQRYGRSIDNDESAGITVFSNHSASSIAEWLDNKEDDIWK